MKPYLSKLVLFICCSFLVHTVTRAQVSTKQFALLPISSAQFLDSQAIYLPSLQFFSDALLQNSIQVASNNYTLEAKSNQFTWLLMPTDTIYVRFQVFPFRLSQSWQSYAYQTYPTDFAAAERAKFQITTPNSQDIFGGSSIQKNGSLSRGVGFGNNQSLGLQSALNLQLSGQLTPNLTLTAALSDANIPLQAAGSTNQLKEFDQVFIQVHNEQLKIIAGDFWLQNPNYSDFLIYKKRGQGITGAYQWKVKNGQIYTQTTAGLSKGKFQRQIIQGKEAVQGPYRLTGANNEPFIMILSGTEKIYIDGRLLTRGQEYDYIIDYNTAELTFTSRNMITKDVRIVAEFQYADQNYSRSLLQHTSRFENKKLQLWVGAYQEQDLKNQPLQQILTDAQKISLSQIGDQLNTAAVPGYENVGFLENANMYEMIDSLGFDSVFVLSVNQQTAIYRCTFTQVGAQQGDYILAGINASGAYYEWVKPENGVSQGNFAPIRKVETPQRKQMLSSGIALQLSPKWKLFTENALSENDLNLYSSLNDNNNLGFSSKGGLSYIKEKSIDSVIKIKRESTLHYTYLGKQFIPIEQFRTVEFDRDWNIRGLNISGQQLQMELLQKWHHSQKGQTLVKFESFQIDSLFRGNRIYTEGEWKNKGWQAKWDGFAMKSKQNQLQNSYIRHRAKLSKQLGVFQLGFSDDHEWNVFHTAQQLGLNSYQFFDAQTYLNYQPKKGFDVKIFYRERFDWRTDSSAIEVAAKARTSGLELKWDSHPKHQLQSIIGTRQLFILDSTLIEQSPENSAVGRLDYSGKFLKNALVINTFYELGSGLEQKRRFQYFKVNDGQGIYAWIDYNNDGIKDLNEFEIAQFIDQAQYIRVFVPSTDYAAVYANEWNQSVLWRPEQIWRNRNGILGIIAKFSNQTKIRVQRKLSEANLAQWLNPLATQIADNALLFANAQLSNSLYFNRNGQRFSAAYNWSNNQMKSLLANGQDAKEMLQHQVNMRLNIGSDFAFENTMSSGKQASFADYTSGRDYALSIRKFEPQLIYQNESRLRLSITGGLIQKENNPTYGQEKSLSKSVDFSWKINKSEQSSVTGHVKYIYFDFAGNQQSAVAYEMLEGLRAGTNVTWGLNFQKTLGKNLQLSLNYSGRAAQGQRSIHAGGMELRAFF